MIDPTKITNFNRTEIELEELLLFSILVAGKNAITTAKSMDKFLKLAHFRKNLKFSPFKCLRLFTEKQISELLYKCGIGCYARKSQYLYELVNSKINLKTCTLEDLINLKGIGFKTANLFLIHSRKGYKSCCIDTHLLKYLNDLGYDVPKTTPQTKKKYMEIQDIFLKIVEDKGITDIAAFDLAIWNKYSGHV